MYIRDGLWVSRAGADVKRYVCWDSTGTLREIETTMCQEDIMWIDCGEKPGRNW